METFEEAKKGALARVSQHIEELQEFKKRIEAQTNMEDLKKVVTDFGLGVEMNRKTEQGYDA